MQVCSVTFSCPDSCPGDRFYLLFSWSRTLTRRQFPCFLPAVSTISASCIPVLRTLTRRQFPLLLPAASAVSVRCFHQGFGQISVEAQWNICRFLRHKHFVYSLCYYYCNGESELFNDCDKKSGRFIDCSWKSGRFHYCSKRADDYIIAVGERTI